MASSDARSAPDVVREAMWNDCLEIAVIRAGSGELEIVKPAEGAGGAAEGGRFAEHLAALAEGGFVHPDDAIRCCAVMRRASGLIELGGDPARRSRRFRCLSGDRFIWASFELLPAGGGDTVFCVRRAEGSPCGTADEELARTFRRLIKIDLPGGTCRELPLHGESGAVGLAAWREAFAREHAVLADDLDMFMDFTDPGAMRERFRGSERPQSCCCRRRGADGKPAWMTLELVPALDSSDDAPAALLCARDIETVAKRDLARMDTLERAENTDELTGLKNRRCLAADIAAVESGPHPRGVGIIFADVNGLRRVNETRGHAAGDVLLRSLGDRLARAFRADSCYRLDGGEFLVMITGIPRELFERRATEFAAAIDGGDAHGASAGSAWAASPPSVAALIRQAEEAMREAKAARRAKAGTSENQQ